jgi:ABC-type hemin transport system ATPase subunit
MLSIEKLHVKLENEDRMILNGLTLAVKPGEVHAIMGPNGFGTVTLSCVLSGRALSPDERAPNGVPPGTGQRTDLAPGGTHGLRKGSGGAWFHSTTYTPVDRKR